MTNADGSKTCDLRAQNLRPQPQSLLLVRAMVIVAVCPRAQCRRPPNNEYRLSRTRRPFTLKGPPECRKQNVSCNILGEHAFCLSRARSMVACWSPLILGVTHPRAHQCRMSGRDKASPAVLRACQLFNSVPVYIELDVVSHVPQPFCIAMPAPSPEARRVRSHMAPGRATPLRCLRCALRRTCGAR